MASSVYNASSLDAELKALREIYNIDLAPMSRQQIKQMSPFEPHLESGYYSLLSDKRRIRALKSTYPRLTFVVGFQPGVTPAGWTTGPFSGLPLDLPKAYENGHYVVYSLP
jgi:hypothetical protein